MNRPHRRSDPYRLYLGLELAMSLILGVTQTTVVVYWVSSGHLDPLRLLLLGTMLEATYFAFQLPTGALADLFSRRASIVAGIVVLAGSYVDESLSPAFVNLLVAQAGVALGSALIYGAQEAWIADELPDGEMTHTYLRATQLGLVGTIAGSLLSGLLMLAGRSVPLLIGGLSMAVVAATLAVVMPENGFRRRQGSIRRTLADAVTSGGLVGQARATRRAVRAVPGLVVLFAMTVFVGMWSESFDRLWGDYLITDLHFPSGLSPGLWFGVIACVASLAALGTTQLVTSRVRRSGDTALTATLSALFAVTAAGVVGMVIAHDFALAIVGYLIVAAVRPAYEPLVNGWLVSRVDSGVRATALSARDMCDSGGQVVGGPVFGLIGTVASIRVALLAGAAVLAPAIGLLAGATRRTGATPAESEVVLKPTQDPA